MAKDKDADTHETKTHAAEAPPKLTKEQIAAALLELYQQRLESASPRTTEELQMIRDLVAK